MSKNVFKGKTNKLLKSIKNITSSEKTVRIAITGLSRAGKTIFITSLIDQLLLQQKIVSICVNHRPFQVQIKTPKHGVKRFDYYANQQIIKEYHQWPEGTDSISSTILEFEKKGKFEVLGNSTFNLELIDYPGEWILDIALLDKSYQQWSEMVLADLASYHEPLVDEYLKTIKQLSERNQGEALAKKLHYQYVEVLRYLKKNHYSNLTPGRFLMPGDLAHDPLLFFAPISDQDSPLYALFKQRYEYYLKHIVKNIQLEHFNGFDRQIVLVDIVAALQNGERCYQDMKKGLESMLSLYDHKKKNFFSQWFSPAINKVLFVATKADLVSSSQHNNYIALLDEMIEQIRKSLDISHIKTDTQVVAAVKCTETVKQKYQGKVLSCIRGIDPKDNKAVVIYPGEMPSSFPHPDDWEPENFSFESFLPTTKIYKSNEAFDHIHMDKLITSILGDLL